MKLLAKISIGFSIFVASIAISYLMPLAFADPLRSANYQFQETSLGGLGALGGQSPSFQSVQSSGGILGIGNSASSNFQINAGNSTTSDPALTFAITSSAINFSAPFSASSTSTAAATFQVLDYTSYGYIVQIYGNAPTFSGYTIAALASAAQPQTGVDQFGINLVANTNPTSLGANPDNGQFGYGQAATNYNTSNYYRYVSGDTIAQGPKSSGLTTYTVSYIVNVAGRDTAGQYTSAQTLLCTATY